MEWQMFRAKVVTVIRWYARQKEMNQEDSEENEVGGMNEEGSWFHRLGDAYIKDRLVIFNDENTVDLPYKFTLGQEIPTVGGKHKHEMFA